MNIDYKLEHFIESLINENKNLNKENFFELIILNLKNNIEFIFSFYENCNKKNKNEIIMAFYIWFLFHKKINWFDPESLDLENVNYNIENFFQLIINFNLDRKIYILFRTGEIIFSKEEMKKIIKTRNNFILININYLEDSKNKVNINIYNLKDILNLHKIKANDWRKIYPNFSSLDKDVYLDKEKYLKIKKEIKNKK